MRVIGLMSGTSMDGVDAALVELNGGVSGDFGWRLLAFRCSPYSDARRRQLQEALGQGGAAELCRLHTDLGEWLAEAALALCEAAAVDPASVAVIGSHGHTVWHSPPGIGRRGATLQLGDAATIAERTGRPVVSDFRAADVAAGGHGAPLVPWPDSLLFSVPGRARALQNLGGIGNVTWLAPREAARPPMAFDTGPANVLLDLAADAATGGGLRCDQDGRLARAGTVDEGLLARLRADPFFDEPPPRSTGREHFGPALLGALVHELGLERGRTDDGWPDLLATLTAFSAWSVGDAYRRWVLPLGVDEVVLAGGGARNPALVSAIERELAPLPVRGESALGVDPDAREAVAFAVLAWAHVLGLSGNVPDATGAIGPRVLGAYTPAPAAGGLARVGT